jgi:hypothetical protein
MSMSFRYVATRLFVAAVMAVLVGLVGGSWYLAGVFGGLSFVVLMVARRGGRYLTSADGSVLRRDERGREIADRAARNGFVVLMLATGTLSMVFHALGRAAVPVGLLEGALALAALAWLASDLWQRRG